MQSCACLPDNAFMLQVPHVQVARRATHHVQTAQLVSVCRKSGTTQSTRPVQAAHTEELQASLQ